MSERSQTVLEEALALGSSERADIADALLASLEPAPDADVAEAWRREVSERLAALDAGRAELVPWDRVRERLFARRNG